MVTKIGKFYQKIGYNSAYLGDIIKIPAPNGGFHGVPI